MRKPGVVVITGGSAGVGRAAALAFARNGDRVAILARGEARVQAACAEVRALGTATLGIPTDVADAARVEHAARRVEDELGPITVWVNNAATTVFAPVADITADEYKRVAEVTYLGTVHGTLAALRRMRERNEGCIVQVGSALAYRSIPLQSAYCASKAAIRGFTDSLRSELIREQSRIDLTMVQLSAFNTPQFDWARNKLPREVQPVPPIFQPEVAADAIVHAAYHPRRELWVGWPAVKAILSTRVVPGLGDRLASTTAHDGQQTDEPARHDAPDSLFAPVSGNYGAHGRFDRRSRGYSVQWQLSKHRAALGIAAAALALGGIAMLQANRAAAGQGRAADLESDRTDGQARRRTRPMRGGDPSMS